MQISFCHNLRILWQKPAPTRFKIHNYKTQPRNLQIRKPLSNLVKDCSVLDSELSDGFNIILVWLRQTSFIQLNLTNHSFKYNPFPSHHKFRDLIWFKNKQITKPFFGNFTKLIKSSFSENEVKINFERFAEEDFPVTEKWDDLKVSQ